MNLEKPSLFSEEVEIEADDNNDFVSNSSSASVVQSLGKSAAEGLLTGSKNNSTINSGSPTTPIANKGQQKFTYNKGLMIRRLDGQGQVAGSGSSNSEKKDDPQPGPSEGQQKSSTNMKSEVGSGIINTAKLLCKSGKINSNQLQQLLKYVTLTRGITSSSSTSGKTDHIKLANLLSQLTQQLKGKQVESVSQQKQSGNHQVDLEGRQAQLGSQQLDLEGRQAQLGSHQSDLEGRQAQLGSHQSDLSRQQVQSIGEQVKLGGQQTHVRHVVTKETFQPDVTKDLSKTLSTAQPVSHPKLCQSTGPDINNAPTTNTAVRSSANITSSRNQGSLVTKMLQGIDLQAFTSVDQALSLFEVAPAQQQQNTPQFLPDSLHTVSGSYCPSTSCVSVKSATTLPTQIDVGHNLDNGMMEANASPDWEYSGTNLADLLIPDNSEPEAEKDDDAWSTASLASGDGQLLRMLKTGSTDELPGTSGISYSENTIQDKTPNDVEASEFYCSPEKVLKLESSPNVQPNVSSGFTNFALPCTNPKSSNMKRKRYKKTADALQGSGLMDITVKTAELIQRNRKLQKDIEQLKSQAAQFYQSVLQNPENREIGEKLKMTEEQNIQP
ncbi:uncharacterized protein LOC110446453 isoform X2 [Mizuhopecten yessoensis]|uniref:ADP-ribosylation factor n=1 Tax=Mizuhopecten yessoensis TaxID=6573 RepID=A0A210QXA2_MIZYE|nr:uncharacterized protein LOC110446453 isoform X2 [Mizuhopecten yessoensis]OWF53388.1 ADP-ribosylation factor [Mizuhopecten yessoensis]